VIGIDDMGEGVWAWEPYAPIRDADEQERYETKTFLPVVRNWRDRLGERAYPPQGRCRHFARPYRTCSKRIRGPHEQLIKASGVSKYYFFRNIINEGGFGRARNNFTDISGRFQYFLPPMPRLQ